jgi:WD40 repeat protein
MEQELQALKAQIPTPGRDVTDHAFTPSESQLTNPEIEAEILALEVQLPQTWKCIKVLQGHEASVNTIAISPDGQALASGSQDKTVSLWNLNKTIRLWSLCSSEQPHILSGHSNWVTSVAISPDSNTLASGSTDGTIKVWNLHTGELVRTMDGQSTGIFSVAINPDGQTLASGSMKAVKLWNIHTGELIQTLPGCSPVAFSADGQTLVTGSNGSTIKIWRQRLGSEE